MASFMSPETVLSLYESKGYACVGLIFVAPSKEAAIAWDGSVPQENRRAFLQAAIDRIGIGEEVLRAI